MKKRIIQFRDEFYNKIFVKIEKNIQKETNQEVKDFFIFLGDLKNIIISDDLKSIVSNVSTKYPEDIFWNFKKKTETDFCEKILKIFDYSGFRSSKNAIWFAKQLNIKTCLFCNCQFATVIEPDNKKEKINFQFDHFYPKSKYPYLSMSIFNLVPICPYCNQTKSNKEIEKIIENPYLNNFDNFSQFKLDNKNYIDFIINPNHQISNALQLIPKRIEDKIKLEEYENLFEITAKHKIHEDFIQEIVWKSNVYTQDYKTQLKNLLHQLSDEDFQRFILGNYSKKDEIFNRPLAKLTHDIAEELGLLNI